MKRKLIMAILTGLLLIGSSITVHAYPIAGVNSVLAQYMVQPIDSNKLLEQMDLPEVEPVIMYSTTRVNVRERATTESDVVKTLNIAEKVKVLYTESGWSKTKDGWIKSEYLSENMPADKLLVTDEERYWLYQLVESEAGIESEECRAWVCCTVFNLMELPGTPDNVVDMIFYKNTYSPTLNGRIYEVVPRDSTKKVVDRVLKEGLCTDARWFVADYCESDFHNKLTKIRQIDHTIFYK